MPGTRTLRPTPIADTVLVGPAGLSSGGRCTAARSIVVVRVWPPRSYVSWAGPGGIARTALVMSSQVVTGVPLTERIRSPSRRPAAFAGLAGSPGAQLRAVGTG